MNKKLSNYPQNTNNKDVWYYEEKGRLYFCVNVDGKTIHFTVRASQLKNNLRRISKDKS